MMYTFTGYDPDGIKRVWAEHQNADVAESMCRDEAMEYVRRRRDTGPLDKWTFTHTPKRALAE